MDSSAFVESYRFLARYNSWFNERLYDACEQLSDPERKRDRGAFFGSIHGSLNHLVWGDRTWLRRFAAQGIEFPSLTPDVLALPAGAVHGTMIHDDWGTLREQRRRLDLAIEAWTRDMPPEFPLRAMRYANSKAIQREHPGWQAITHSSITRRTTAAR